jgi:twitching motility protein PilT
LHFSCKPTVVNDFARKNGFTVPLLTSLLTAIARADGDALVLHSGERPYVVAPTGQSQLSSRVLTLDAMTGMLRELLPEDSRRTLDEDGAVQHDLLSPTNVEGERFTVVAARGGDDIWIEIRRHRYVAPEVELRVEPEAEPVIEPASAPVIEPVIEPLIEPVTAPMMQAVEPIVQPPNGSEAAEDEPVVHLGQPHDRWPPAIELVENERDVEVAADPDDVVHELTLDDGMQMETPFDAPLFEVSVPPPFDALAAPPVESVAPFETSSLHAAAVLPEPIEPPKAYEPRKAVVPPPESMPPPLETFEPESPIAAAPPPFVLPPQVDRRADAAPESHAAHVVSLARNQGRDHSREKPPIRFVQPLQSSGIDRLLRLAAARGASTLFLTSQAKPSIRINGEISLMEGEPVLTEPEVEALMLEIVPESHRDALQSDAGAEWTSDVPDVGRIRCVTFRDHRGAGGIFRMITARAISAEQLGLSREIQALCDEANGLILVAGARSSGKSTLISAFVDLINRTRSDHVVTLEQQIKFVHENRGSLVSQREVRGDKNEWLSASRAALRENPDVLVIEDLNSPEIVALALDAAQSEHLVIGAVTAHTATEAIERMIEQTPADRRPAVKHGLSEALRGVVAQVLLRKTGGGRVAAREVLLNTPAVANVIGEGRTSQLPMAMAIDSGRRHGMVALNDALIAFVQSGIVDSREAYRNAADQQGFLALMQRQGLDTSFVERLA